MGKDCTYKLRLDSDELERWKFQALLHEIPLSQWIRDRCAENHVKTEREIPTKVDRKRKEVTVSPERKGVPTCKHGRERGYNCGMCGGMAVIE